MKTNEVICNNCKKNYTIDNRAFNKHFRESYNNFYCTNKCQAAFRTMNAYVTKPCLHCNNLVSRLKSGTKKSKTTNIFCNNSCAATYNNKNKKFGTRLSKYEKYLHELLPVLYPNLTFKFLKKEEINSELDIYIPLLRIGIEINGIFHYKPIYGEDKLKLIKANDDNKVLNCKLKNIDLHIIDVSSMKRFNGASSEKYTSQIKEIINNKLNIIR